MLEETSWNNLWGGIISTDFPNGSDALQINIDEDSGVSIHNVEENIECWATQTMPLMIDPSFDSQESFQQAIPPVIPMGDTAAVCYGMVSYALLLPLPILSSIVPAWSLILKIRSIELVPESEET
jgi:hypothetical protein